MYLNKYNNLNPAQIPESLAPCVIELSTQLGLPLEIVLTTYVLFLGSALGRAVCLDCGVTGQSVGTNLFQLIGAEPASPLNLLLDHVLAPFRTFQAEGLRACGAAEQEEAIKQLKQNKQALQAWGSSSPYRHVAALQKQQNIERQIAALEQPLLLLENPKAADVLPALQRASQECLFVFTSAEYSPPLLDRAAELLQCGWAQRPFIRPLLRKKRARPAVRPCLSWLGVISPPALECLLTNPRMAAIASCCLAWKNFDPSGSISERFCQPLCYAPHWAKLCRQALERRYHAPIPYTLAPAASSRYGQFLNELQSADKQADSPALAAFLGQLPQITLRLALVLQVCHGHSDRKALVEAGSMETAIALSSFFAEHHREILARLQDQRQRGEAEAVESRLLEEFQREHLLSLGRIRRLMHPAQSETVYDALDSLIARKCVTRNETTGLYALAETPATPGQSEPAPLEETAKTSPAPITLLTA